MEGPEIKKRKIHRPPPSRETELMIGPFACFKDSQSKTPNDAKSTSTLRDPGYQQVILLVSKYDRFTGNFKKFDSRYGNFLMPVVSPWTELKRLFQQSLNVMSGWGCPRTRVEV